MKKIILSLAVAATLMVSGASSAFAGYGFGYGGYGHSNYIYQPTIVVPAYRVQYVQPYVYPSCFHGHCW